MNKVFTHLFMYDLLDEQYNSTHLPCLLVKYKHIMWNKIYSKEDIEVEKPQNLYSKAFFHKVRDIWSISCCVKERTD